MNIKKLARELADKSAPREYLESKTLPARNNQKEPKGQSHGSQSTREREGNMNWVDALEPSPLKDPRTIGRKQEAGSPADARYLYGDATNDTTGLPRGFKGDIKRASEALSKAERIASRGLQTRRTGERGVEGARGKDWWKYFKSRKQHGEPDEDRIENVIRSEDFKKLKPLYQGDAEEKNKGRFDRADTRLDDISESDSFEDKQRKLHEVGRRHGEYLGKPKKLPTEDHEGKMIGDQGRIQELLRSKSDFDALLNAINLNILNSYSKFRNKDDSLDSFIASEKKRTGETDNPTKLEKPKGTVRESALGDSTLEYQLSRRGKPSKQESRHYQLDRRIASPKYDKEGKVIPKQEPKEEPRKNPYKQDEKGKYIRGTGYEKPVTGSRTQQDRTRGGGKAQAQHTIRTSDRHEGTHQAGTHGRYGLFSNPNTDAGGRKGVHGENNILGIETQEPLAPHRHLREQDKEGKIVRNRYSTDPTNVKWRKGGKPYDEKDQKKRIEAGMKRLKANLTELMKKIQDTTFGTTYEDTGGLTQNIPSGETFGDQRFRGKPAGVKHRKPKNEEERAENTEGKKLLGDQWNKDFAMHYISPDKKEAERYQNFKKTLKALMMAKLSPVSFNYTYKGWGNTYERGQTKNVETQDHSRTGNTNTNQTYKKDKDDLTIKSLDEVYKEWKKKVE